MGDEAAGLLELTSSPLKFSFSRKHIHALTLKYPYMKTSKPLSQKNIQYKKATKPNQPNYTSYQFFVWTKYRTKKEG